jgi:hypothetical protein
MSTMNDPTLQAVPTTEFAPAAPAAPAAPTATAGAPAGPAPVAVRGSTPGGDLHDIRPEDPKRNPITYLALGIAVLALLLSLFALTRDTGPNQIDVGGRRCIVDRIDGNKADTLFCQS